MGTLYVRNIESKDYKAWHAMWQAYCVFGISSKVTHALWKRLTNRSPRIGMPEGLVVIDTDDTAKILGFCHYVLHAHTWGTGWQCHCEDLYVTPEARHRRAGAAMLHFLQTRGKFLEWDCIYGHTDKDNPAQHLYAQFTPVDDKLTFTLDLLQPEVLDMPPLKAQKETPEVAKSDIQKFLDEVSQYEKNSRGSKLRVGSKE